MNKVEAIKFNDDIVKMYEALKIKSERDYLFFKLAIHSGLKVSELLTITVSQVKRLIEKYTLSEMCKAHFHSLIKIRLPETLSKELLQYIDARVFRMKTFFFNHYEQIEYYLDSKHTELFIKHQLKLA